MTDRRTDRQTDARGKTICLPTLKVGDIIAIGEKSIYYIPSHSKVFIVELPPCYVTMLNPYWQKIQHRILALLCFHRSVHANLFMKNGLGNDKRFLHLEHSFAINWVCLNTIGKNYIKRLHTKLKNGFRTLENQVIKQQILVLIWHMPSHSINMHLQLACGLHFYG